MGEKEKNIFNVGSLTAENVKSFKKKGKNEIEKNLISNLKKKILLSLSIQKKNLKIQKD